MLEVELNDPDYMENVASLHVSVLEPLYWVMEDAISNGDLKLARAIFKEFVYVAKYRKEMLSQGLKKGHISRLQAMAHELFGDGSYKKRQPIQIKSSLSPLHLPFAKEAELQKYLAENPQVLSDAPGDRIRVTGTEVETDFEYRCDITAESGKTFYPIELKIGQADHAVVSQCNKYCFYFYRRLRYNWYKEIQGVVCANGFCDWSINELRREGLWCFSIIPDKSGISLRRIE